MPHQERSPAMATNTVTKTKHKSLRHALEELLLTKTQEEVGDMLGVSGHWVSLHTTGGCKTVQKKRMPGVARGLGMTTEDLARLCRASSNNV